MSELILHMQRSDGSKQNAKVNFILNTLNGVNQKKCSLVLEDLITRIEVSIKNLGREWLPPSMSENGINLSYRWKTPKGKILKTEGIRTSITKVIKNNEKVNLEAKIKAPSEPGKYILEFDMVKEGHFWFSEAYKSDTRKVNVLVIN